MKLIAVVTLLFTLLLCVPAPLLEKNRAQVRATNVNSMTTDGSKPVVCLDPGHPSEVASGKNMQHGTNETHVDWAVAVRLQKLLEEAGYTVVLTKSSEDELVRNKDRALIANRAGAALMVRLHCDASVEHGYAIYYPDRQGHTKDGARGPSASIIEASARAAQSMHAGMSEALAGVLNDNGVRTDEQTKVGHEQGGALTGSIFSAVPVVTIEMVVLSDEHDAAFIKTPEGEQQMAEAIALGIKKFVETTSQQKQL